MSTKQLRWTAHWMSTGDTDLDDTDVDGTLDVTGVATLATVDINGGSIDGTTIGFIRSTEHG